MDNHIVEEISKLGNGETDGVAKLGRSLLGSNSVILVTDSREGLEVRIYEKNVRALDINERGSGIRVSLLRAGAHDILNSLIKQFSSHDHAVCFTVICDKLEHTAGGHDRVLDTYRAIGGDTGVFVEMCIIDFG
jgi:hypothetical protein